MRRSRSCDYVSIKYIGQMLFDKYISLPVFLMAFAIGSIFVFLTPPESSKVVVYPTPDNKDTFLYGDKAENCFEFRQTEVACPSDRGLLKHIPFQM